MVMKKIVIVCDKVDLYNRYSVKKLLDFLKECAFKYSLHIYTCNSLCLNRI